MRHLLLGFKLAFLALFSLALSGCFFEEEALIANETLYVESGDLVEVTAREGGGRNIVGNSFLVCPLLLQINAVRR